MDTNNGNLYLTQLDAIKAGVQKDKIMEVDGSKLTPYQRATMKVQRNDPCPCGSGLKFKKCHLGKSV